MSKHLNSKLEDKNMKLRNMLAKIGTAEDGGSGSNSAKLRYFSCIFKKKMNNKFSSFEHHAGRIITFIFFLRRTIQNIAF